MIHGLTLKNFRQHADLALAFKPGLNVLVGPNGAGKTSVVQAVLFALGGVSATGTDADHLWNWDDEKGKRSVSLTLDLPGHAGAVVERTHRSAKVVTAVGLAASGTTPCTLFLDEAYGLPLRDRLLLQHSEQGEAQELVKMGGAALQQRVEALAGVGVLDAVAALIRDDLAGIDGALGALPDVSCLEQRESELHALHAVQSLAEVRRDAAQAEAGRLALEAASLRSAAENATTSRAKAAALDARIDEIETRRREDLIPAAGEIAAKLAQFPDGLSRMAEEAKAQAAKDKERSDTATLALRLAQAAVARIGKLEAALPAAEEKADKEAKWVAHLSETDALLLLAKGRQTTARELAKESNDARTLANRLASEAACPTCKRPYPEKDPEALQAVAKLAEEDFELRKAELAEASEDLATVEEAVDKAKRMVGDGGCRGALLSMQSALREAKQECPEGLSDLETQADQAVASLAYSEIHLAKLSSALEKRAELRRREAENDGSQAKARAALEQYRGELTRLGDVPSEDEVAKLKARADDAGERLEAARQALDKAKDALAQAEASYGNLHMQVNALQDAAAQVKKLSASKAGIEALRKWLRDNRNRLASGLWDGLLDLASALAASATEGRVRTDGRDGQLGSLGRRADGKFTVEEGGRRMPVSELGGAMRSVVSLCLKVALAKTFYGDGLPLLLDEAAEGASAETAAAIAGLLSSVGMQVIAVSHQEAEAVFAGNVIEIGGR